ncbi:GIY-YIG nuclease family protein [Ekhidna sp.]|uniref:GIY-YIG nuclease family protein n=1 Tax=Ekhidna sp. TaxID=2608089 RepID=UPI003B58C11D
MTNDLERRITEHYLNRGTRKSFAGKNYCYKILYYQKFDSAEKAIEAEKEIKNWRRELKENLINEFNPKWEFLNARIMQWPPPPENSLF